MDIKVEVPRKRKCHSSLDWNNDKQCWIMSFGDLRKPETDVEIEFTPTQLHDHRKMVNDLYRKLKKDFASKEVHVGTC